MVTKYSMKMQSLIMTWPIIIYQTDLHRSYLTSSRKSLTLQLLLGQWWKWKNKKSDCLYCFLIGRHSCSIPYTFGIHFESTAENMMLVLFCILTPCSISTSKLCDRPVIQHHVHNTGHQVLSDILFITTSESTELEALSSNMRNVADICKGPISFYERGILLISCMEISSQVFMLLLCFFSEVSCFVYSAPVIMQGC